MLRDAAEAMVAYRQELLTAAPFPLQLAPAEVWHRRCDASGSGSLSNETHGIEYCSCDEKMPLTPTNSQPLQPSSASHGGSHDLLLPPMASPPSTAKGRRTPSSASSMLRPSSQSLATQQARASLHPRSTNTQPQISGVKAPASETLGTAASTTPSRKRARSTSDMVPPDAVSNSTAVNQRGNKLWQASSRPPQSQQSGGRSL